MLPKDFAKSVVHDAETTLTVAISPCCWMYPNYPFQIQVHIAETGDHTIVSKKRLSFADATEADVDALVASLTIVRCPRCQSPMFERTGNEAHNPEKVCSKCILADLNEQYEVAKKKSEGKQKKEDAKMKAQGYTHRINARIHPAAGGDDYQVVMYASRRPTKATMKSQLRKLGSEVFDDYLITQI
jgi:endogenous inhibitor of DNA gyrase (YacG/DUF329 family)